MLKEIETTAKAELQVNWQYKSIDEEMQESGEDFQEMTNVKINFVAID